MRKLLGKGTVLRGRYQIRRVLGCGGMGAVYYALDLALNTPVAVKENLDVTTEGQQQFAMEAKILATLRHPNLPRVRDYFRSWGRQYLVMDYIAGESLHDRVERQGTLRPSEALHWMKQVMDAVRYLHTQNPPIIHRDIKPANIKLSPDGRAYLVDFGIAKVLRAGSRTQAGARAITPGFSPPEQYGTAPTDQRSDIYALGATLYFALTGRVPPEAIDRIATSTDRLIPPRSINPTIPPTLERVILRAMAIRPERRYPSVAQMITELQSSLRSRPFPSSPRPSVPTPFPRAPVGLRFASGWERFIAFFLDVLLAIPAAWLTGLVGLGVYAMIRLFSGSTDIPVSQGTAEVWLTIWLTLSVPVYRVVAHSLTGQTVGKAMVGLQVVQGNGRPCRFGQALIREGILWLQLICCLGLGLLWAVLDPRRQGWHDLVAGTIVVKR